MGKRYFKTFLMVFIFTGGLFFTGSLLLRGLAHADPSACEAHFSNMVKHLANVKDGIFNNCQSSCVQGHHYVNGTTNPKTKLRCVDHTAAEVEDIYNDGGSQVGAVPFICGTFDTCRDMFDPGECTATTGVTNLFNNTFPDTFCKDATVDVSTFRDGIADVNVFAQVGGLNEFLTLQFTADVDYQGESFTSNVSIPVFPPNVPSGIDFSLDTPVGGSCTGTTDSSFTLANGAGNLVLLIDPTTCMGTSDSPILVRVESDGTGSFAAGFTAYVDAADIIDTDLIDFTTPSTNPLVAGLLDLTNTTDLASLIDTSPIDIEAVLTTLGAVRIQFLVKQVLITAQQLLTNLLCVIDSHFVTAAISTDVGTEGCVVDMVDANSTTLIDTCISVIDFGGL